MSISNLLIYFFAGGIFTTVIVVLEESDQRIISGLAALIPVFTLIAYFFIGSSKGGIAVSQHAKFVLFGTLVAWVPYMLAVVFLAPKIGAHKAILVGLIAFFVLAALYILVVKYFNLFE